MTSQKTNQESTNDVPARRTFLKQSGACAAALGALTVTGGAYAAANCAPTIALATEWDKTFEKSDKVDHQKVTFKTDMGSR